MEAHSLTRSQSKNKNLHTRTDSHPVNKIQGIAEK